MPATQIVCPSCRAPLRVATPLPAGRPVKCPHCAKTFPVTLQVVAPAKPPVAMHKVSCPKCAATLRTASPLAPGRLSKCPKCAHVFRVPGKVAATAKPRAAEGAKPPAAVSQTWLKCPKCRTVLRFPGVVAPGKPVKCGKCTMVFLVPPKQTRLAPPAQPKVTTLAPSVPAKPPAAGANGTPRPVLRLDCPGCRTPLKLTGTLPVGKTLQCPKCKRPVRLSPRKPAAKTKLVSAPGKKTRLASGPAKKTKLAAGLARPTKLAARAAAKTQLAPQAPQPAKPQATVAKLPAQVAITSTVRPQAAAVERRPAWVGPVKVGLYVALAGAVVALGVVGAGFFGLGPLGAKGDIPTSEWQEFAPPGGRCQLSMPGTPSSLRVTPDGLGGADARHFVLLRKDDDIAFKLTYWDRPAAKVPFKDVCTAVEQKLNDEVKGIVVQRADISLDGHTGREWHIEPEGGGTLIARMYEAKGSSQNRTYVLLVGVGRLRQSSGSVNKFFDSFRINNQ